MVYVALAVVCSLLIGMIFKHAGRSGMDLVELLTVNYVVAAVPAGLALSLSPLAIAPMFTPGLIALGITTGVLFIGGFFLFALATARSGLSLSIAVMRISIAIPFLGSWFIWGEEPSTYQMIGLLLAFGALFLITHGGGSENGIPNGMGASGTTLRRWGGSALLIFLFLSGGAVDLCMKTFGEEFGQSVDTGAFILLVFLVAFVTGVAVLLRRESGIRTDARTLIWGVVLGIVNYGSAQFLLMAVARLPGTVVFPTNGVAIVLGGALLGTVFWGERLRWANWAGMALAAAALGLLSG